MPFSLSTVVAAVAPQWERNRQVARQQLSLMAKPGPADRGAPGAKKGQFFAAATPGNNRPQAPQLGSPNDWRQAAERIVLIRYAQQMEEDIPYIESILSDFETYVVGDLRYRPATGNTEADNVICAHLEWRFAECDYARELDLTGIARLAIRSKKRDGEQGACYMAVEDTLKLGLVEADCIGNPMMVSSGDPFDFNGIIVHPRSGEKLTFKIWRRLQTGSYVFETDVSGNQFIHYYDKYRVSQKHGITAFRTGITRAIDVEQTIQFAIQNIKFRSSQLPAIRSEGGTPVAGSGYSRQAGSVTGPDYYTVEVDGVTQRFINTGTSFIDFPHDFPNANFSEITGDLKGDVALGVHLPPEFCFRSEAGGVLQRFYIEKAQRTFDEEKREIKRILLNPYKNRVLRMDVDSGVLDLSRFPGLAGSLNLYKGAWHMGRSVSTDYGNDTDSDIKLIDNNLMSAEEHAADNARDLAEIRLSKKARAREIIEDTNEIAKETGRTFEQVLPLIVKQFANPAAPSTQLDMPELDGLPAQVKPLIATIGVGGTQALTQILAQISDGSLDRSAAIATLQIVFGVSAEQAASMVPDSVPEAPAGAPAPAPAAPGALV